MYLCCSREHNIITRIKS
uniref:Uncharacterized protein n=1 Tax=Arundo donax TaxID=35708 RepID=A0A0A9ALH1_ARUDO